MRLHLIASLSGEQVDQLQVLELGCQGGRERGATPIFAHRVGDFEEGGDRAGRRDVTTLESYDRATHLRILLYRYEHEVAGRDRPDHGSAGQKRDPQPVLDHPLGGLDIVDLYSSELPYAGVPEQGVRLLEVARVVVEEDELLLTDLGQARCTLPGEPVPWIYDEHQFVLIERQALDFGVAHRPRETELHLLLERHLEDRLGMPGPHRDRNPRMRRREPLQ